MRLITKVSLLILLGFGLGRGVINTSTLSHLWTTTPTYHGLTVIQHAYGEDVDESIVAWRIEVTRRFSNAVIIMGHGGTLPNGEWGLLLMDKHNAFIPMKDEVARVQALYPGRVVVLVCCNPDGLLLHMPNVYHAVDSVWFDTDKSLPNLKPEDQPEANEGRKDLPGYVGNIYEFNDD
jgi:hypothetical protein